MASAIRQFAELFKLRIGAVISFTALAGVAVTPGALAGWKITVLGLAVLVASASAGAFNQYVERDIDARMQRTRRRPFVTGTLQPGLFWLGVIVAMLSAAVVAAAAALNTRAAFYVFLGAFVYAVVYTVWLKRRTWLNIIVGGLAGSFAVLAGAAAVSPDLDPRALILAIACKGDYDAAGVPMLPVVVGEAKAARIICAGTSLLVAASLAPMWYGMGWVYLVGAVAGGSIFLVKSIRLARHPTRAAALACFHASLLHLGVLLTASMLDASWR